MTQTATQTAASIDIINARLPGEENLQQILIREGKIVGIEAQSREQRKLAARRFPSRAKFAREGTGNSANSRLGGFRRERSLQEREQAGKGQEAIGNRQEGGTGEGEGLAVEVLDVQGDWVSLGGVDLQINGALGLAFPEVAPQHFPKLAEIGQYLWNQGIDGFLPTIVTATLEQIRRSLATFAEFMRTPPSANSAQILGIHLEGPFLNAEKRGAHPQDCLLPLTLDNVKRVLGDYADIVKIITLAPELDPTGEAIPFLRNLGITVSLGHSQATLEQANLAFSQGATMVTHAFNAMPGLHHRQPGLLGAALAHPNVHCGLIADGQHVCPTMLRVLLQSARGKLAQPGKISGVFLVSDALAPLGLPDGVYPWDERQIEIKDGTARLLDGTLAGTAHPLLVGAQNLVKWGLCSVSEGIALATSAPTEAIDLSGIINSSATGLLRWTQQEDLSLTYQRLFPNLPNRTL